ncbi:MULTISPECIES: hypothetical protein [unclassified Agrococcus]|uniref:VG15 protein n=1 Tax=unclassified Agrococcus TaxID=2615065 RepID=UPI00360F4E33
MPRRWVSDAEARTLRDLQLGAGRLIREELTLFFGSLNLERPEAVRDALLQFVPSLVQRYGEGAAAVAADWYDDVRSGLNVRGSYRARVADPIEEERIDRMVRFAAQHLFTETPALMLAALAAPAARYVVEQGRLTIVASTREDPRSRGWERRARGTSCSFCKALAQRGRVYRYDTNYFAAHNDCGCTAVPSWDPQAREVPVDVYEASRRTDGMKPRELAAHRERVRTLVDRFESGDYDT